MSGTDFLAGGNIFAWLSKISWQAQRVRKVRYRFRGTFARLGTDFAAGAILSQGQVHIAWQAQYFVTEGTIPLFQLQLENRKLSTKVVFEVHLLFQMQLENRKSTTLVFEVHFSSCSPQHKSSFRSIYIYR